jgi:hypothetical protein
MACEHPPSHRSDNLADQVLGILAGVNHDASAFIAHRH